MNLSGKSVHYWLQELKIEKENLLVLVDELALPYGKIKIKNSGSDGGHNGLKSMQESLLTQQYPRLRFGISNEFEKGRQIDYVLGKWSSDEKLMLDENIKRSAEAVKCFCLEGLNNAMNKFNK
jgi:PTH1 family peptidyl-tRNA hydrolase